MPERPAKAGRYEIVSEIGRGSMGVVYKGYDPIIARTVAIKTLLTSRFSPQEYEDYRARFRREAQTAGTLAHPHIVTIYDFGEDSGMLYLAMEFLEGKSLEAVIKEKNVLPIETIIPIYEQVCGALDLAHQHKIVHRDIKPANIMILNSGAVKVTDFGIAKMLSMGMTQTGQILGTPNYMSPEQVRNRPIDGRSDIFSLGVILYEMATGEKPFGGQNITTVVYKIIHDEPIPPRELDATIHPGLSYVITKALAKSPDERYQTCAELAADLKNYKNVAAAGPSATVVSSPAVLRPELRPAGQRAIKPAETSMPSREPAKAAGMVEPSRSPAPAPAIVQPPRRPAKAVKGARPPSSIPAAVWVLSALIIVSAAVAYYFLIFRANSTSGANPGAPVPAAAVPVAEPGRGTASTRSSDQSSGESPQSAAAPAAVQSQVNITTHPTGAEVLIDGRLIGNGPAHAEIPPGRHQLTVRSPGHQTYEGSFELGSEGQALDVTLDENPTAKVEAKTAAKPDATSSDSNAPVK
jgi:serine/threonine-protein kinase